MSTTKVILISFVVSLLVSVAVVMVLPKLQQGGADGPDAKASADEVEVPALRGMTAEQAGVMLEALGLKLVLDGEVANAEMDKGLIVSERPLPGSSFEKGWAVKVEISTGVETVSVPGLAGLQVEVAREKLAALGLEAEVSARAPSATVPLDQVILATPAAGSESAAGAVVKLVVSSGPAQGGVEVPKLKGAKYVNAKGLLRKAGFVVGEVKYRGHPEAVSSTVLSQRPEAGAMALPGSPVDLVVNTAE